MNAVLRCKMTVYEVLHVKNRAGETEQERVKLVAVTSSNPDSENAQWSKWTPSATFEISISSLGAIGKLSSGHEYYVDFTPVP
jgi:hypothetical protein